MELLNPLIEYVSLCSGMEALTCALGPMDPWVRRPIAKPLAFADPDLVASAVLAHKWPGVPNHGDMTTYPHWAQYRGRANLVAGGPPCQDFSDAGPRAGIEGERGNLSLEFVRIVGIIQPRFVLYENVPGLLTSGKYEDGTNGKDFETLIKAFEDIGYFCWWRILDAQYFGVPQRRRRVFLLACRSRSDLERLKAILSL